MSAQVPGAERSLLRATSRSNEFASSEAAASRWKKNARSDRKDRRRSSATSAKERRSLVPRYRCCLLITPVRRERYEPRVYRPQFFIGNPRLALEPGIC